MERTARAWPAAERRRVPGGLATLPGWVLMAAVAAVSVVFVELVAPYVAIGGRNPFEAASVAILVGIALRALGWVPAQCGPGLRKYESGLKVGIVLLGLGLTVGEIVRLGIQPVIAVVVCLIVAPAFIYVVTRRVGMTRNLGILLGVGTTICGTAAIALTAPLVGAKDEEVSYAVSTVSLFGAMAMIALPLVGGVMAMTDVAFGVWAGLAVPSTPQVVGTGYMFSAAAGAQATVVKLTRNAFMIPAALILSVWCSRGANGIPAPRQGAARYASAVPGFVVGFAVLVVLRSLIDTLGLIPADMWHVTVSLAATASKVLILLAMAGIGLNTRFEAVRTLGRTPLFVGVLGAAFLAAFSWGVVRALGIGA